MVTSVLLSLVYLVFPLLVYYIYMFYSKATYEKERLIFLDLALFTSFYLCSKFGNLSVMSAFLINIPLLISFYKKRIIPSIILSIGVSSVLSNLYDINIVIYISNYLVILVFSFLTKFKTANIFVLLKIIYDILIIMFFSNSIINFSMIDNFIIIRVIMYFLFNYIILFYSKIETIVKMYHSLEEITKEKTMYESLFKITHEIKNPLAVCKGYLDMFDIKDPGKANKYIGIIDQEIDRTLVLLKDFSDVSKINIEKNEMDITMLMEDVCDEAKIIFKNNMVFNCNIDNKEVYINGDYNRLKQVLVNVIKNAKEAIAESGEVLLEAKKIKNNYIITVKDNGVGMDKETIKKIGTPFYTTKKSGTGLGVCFSREIVERHNGVMSYFSKEEKGTTVKIILPINKTPVC